ncbi:acyltransferase [Alcanivorax sp. S6407]|uniref:acyltransferase family protein n=1 Tax=Alcanivorax sp. S6407 TaxID=2926424 RepID=UPI001FF4B590|nr:acyltransferase family protein [Alcanivorax sp. S6407]MCK0155055.1 acyltransferase [Alcanivorax sp. S6407]
MLARKRILNNKILSQYRNNSSGSPCLKMRKRTPIPNAPPHFRTDIEGLRAIAVLLVIGAHYSIPGLSAGFIGVDLFFVISGYLITGLLVRELQKSDHISLSRFYANRFRRLFPALATMLVASSIAANAFLPELQNLYQSKAASMAASWISNIHFAFSDADYFQAETTTNAFLHTWSLGVEEQFYLIWPLLILLAAGTFPARTVHARLWLLFITISALSLCACIFMAKQNPVMAFYLMPTRAWQFAAGAITWLLVQKHPPGLAGSLAGSIGLGLLLLGLTLIGHETVYPGAMALIPTLAACAWLWAGSDKKSILHTGLSLPALQWLGKISYSLYLWHWPVLILTDHLFSVHGDISNTLLAISISVLLAVFTYHVIETPLRYGKCKELKASYQLTITLAAMAILTTQLLRWNAFTMDSLDRESRYIAAASDAPPIYPDGCDDWYRSDNVNPCIYGNPDAQRTVALLGDSIGAQWFSTLEKMHDLSDWRLVVLTKSSCPMIDEPFFYKRIGREYIECETWRNKAIEWLKGETPERVFVGSSASVPFTDQQIINGTRRLLDKLSTATMNIYLIEPNPVLQKSGPSCLMENGSESVSLCSGNTKKNTRYKHTADLLESVATAYDNTYWIETASYVCPGGMCSAERDGSVIFRDEQHLTATFAASASQHFLNQIQQPLQGKATSRSPE